MKKVIFSKYSGAGNDFILIDNRDGKFPYHRKDLMGAMASRRTSIGADGIILLENSDKADFRMRYFNCDGGEAEMCGNGARCLIAFAKKIGIEKEEYAFETMERVLGGKFVGNEIEVQMGPPVDMDLDISLKVDGAGETVHYINTGVPHAVLFVDDIEKADVTGLGRGIRFHKKFQPKGANVDFVEIYEEDYIKVRTYERGVEDETLACGTGMTAAAIIAHLVRKVKKPVWLLVRSDEILRVDFEQAGESFENVVVRGPARLIYDGVFYYDRKAGSAFTG